MDDDKDLKAVLKQLTKAAEKKYKAGKKAPGYSGSPHMRKMVFDSIPEGVGGSVPIKGWCPWIWGVRHGGHMEASLPGQEQQAVAQGGGGGQDDWGSS